MATEQVFTESQLQAIAQALADTSEGLSGSEIAYLLSSIGMADPTPTVTKWKRLFNAFVARQNHSQNRRAVLEFIRRAMKPERYAKKPDRFEPMRASLNRALAFCGHAVDASGKLSATAAASTLGEAMRRANELRADLVLRGVHPDVIRFCRAELVADNYFHAVLEAAKSIFDKLRAKTGFTEDGGQLVDRAFAGDAPRLAINALTTESQKSEQRGFANLLKGTYGMFRNTTAHEARIHWPMGKADAEDSAYAGEHDSSPDRRGDRTSVSAYSGPGRQELGKHDGPFKRAAFVPERAFEWAAAVAAAAWRSSSGPFSL